MPVYTAEVLDVDESVACGQLWIDLLSTQQAVHGYFDQHRQDNTPAFIQRVQQHVVQRAYKPVLPGFSGQRSACFLAKLSTQESEKWGRKKKRY